MDKKSILNLIDSVKNEKYFKNLQNVIKNDYSDELLPMKMYQAMYPQDFIDILFYSGSDVNHGNYKNEKVDDLILEARTELDQTRRFLLYNQAEQIVVDEAPIFPLWFDTDGYALVKPWVKGYSFTPIIVPKYKDMYIE